MTLQREAVATLAPLFRASDEPRPLLLLGAGASFRFGVPTAAEAVKQIARIVYSERELAGARSPERIRPGEWEPWLQKFPWFIHGADRLAENFPLVVEHLLRPAEFRKRVLTELMRPQNEISAGYKVLSGLVMRGLVSTMLTTNFDTCLPEALKARQPHIRSIHEVNRSPGDTAQFGVFNKCQIIWLHGRAEHYSDRNVTAEVSSADSGLVNLLRPLLDGAPIIVIGYRGAEPSIMEGLFGQNKEGRLDFPHGIYWCIRRGETPHPYVDALARRVGSNFRYVHIEGFDELFLALDKELEGEDRYSSQAVLAGQARHIPAFDERVEEGATLGDLDLDLALTVMREYCVKLKRAPVTRETLLPIMREQGLVVHDAGADKVTAGAILLFGKDTQAFFPQAAIAVTEAGKKRELFESNLISQHRALLAKLESEDVNPLLKVKKRRQHDERTAYPPRALVELLVNMIVHRDYDVHEPARINIIPGEEIAFSNPGALTQKVARLITLGEDGRFTLSESVTDTRNPALCDIFFAMSAMEREGTGIIDVGQLMTGWGGASAFYHLGGEARFEARVAQPQASAGSQTVARLDVPTGIYVLNTLPFSVVPDAISIVQLTKPWEELAHRADFSDCGTFIVRGSELWSFVPLPVFSGLIGHVMDKEVSVTVAREHVEASDDSKRVLSWLLRKHWERHLLGFSDQGLVLEGKKKHRAYFEAKEGSLNRLIAWDSRQRRGNKREVAKKRGEGHRAWFENEGFGYDIVELGGQWGVRIKPFYMFTGRDGKKPLPSFARTTRATSRVKFDRNKNVEADLAFWSTFLGRGGETINIGGRHVDDLLLEAAFLTVEAPEIGLIKDEPEHQDRMPA
jgi:hypothetical protein